MTKEDGKETATMVFMIPLEPAPKRLELLQGLAAQILALPVPPVLKVGIDGVDGAGKTTFSTELAEVLAASGRPMIRASVDGFHNPRAVRYRLGKRSPEGFFRDSYNYGALKAALLDPLNPGGTGRYRTAVFDHRMDAPVEVPEQQAAPGSILLVDGIFLHRPELRAYWDLSVFLEVDFGTSIPRGAQRGEGSPDPHAPENRRYVEGQRLYLQECHPREHASVVVNNERLERPFIVPNKGF